MTRFDGVALLTVAATTARARTLGERDLTTVLAERPVLRLPDGSSARAQRPPGLPPRLPAAADGTDVVLTGLTWYPRRAESGAPLAELSGRTAAGRWALGDAAVLPPAPTDDLVAVQPLGGGRVHLGHADSHRGGTGPIGVGPAADSMTSCGRLPLRGHRRPAGTIDCERCLGSTLLTERHDRQLAAYPELVALVGPLLAGAAARLWLRLAHREPTQVPAVLDGAVGAIVHGFPGAPTTEETVALVARYRDHASAPALAWARDVAGAQLDLALAAQRRRREPGRCPELATALQLLGDVLAPAEAAELLLTTLEAHGPAPELEPLVLMTAQRAGAEASERVQRWRRRHEIAAVLSAPQLSATHA